jgi:hypothetical protein
MTEPTDRERAREIAHTICDFATFFCTRCGQYGKACGCAENVVDRAERTIAKTLETGTAAVRAETVEQCAKINEEWMKADALLLACGEMSAQEIRTVKAVLAARAAAIRSLKTGDNT